MRLRTLIRATLMASALASGTALMVGLPARAAATPYVMPQSSRIVVFNYSRYRTYTILTRPMSVTDIQLAPGEKLESLAVGDSVQWITALAPGNILIKPVKSGLFTSATIITNERVYEVTLRSGPLTGRWYQQVSWQYPQILLYNQEVAAHRARARKRARRRRHDLMAGEVGNPARLNFDYTVRGRAAFRPRVVFDNGVWTWIHLPDHSQVTPALFIRRHNGHYALTRYVVKGHYLIVQRTFHRAVLRQGGHRVTIVNRRQARGQHGGGHRRRVFVLPSVLSAGG